MCTYFTMDLAYVTRMRNSIVEHGRQIEIALDRYPRRYCYLIKYGRSDIKVIHVQIVGCWWLEHSGAEEVLWRVNFTAFLNNNR